MTSNQDTSDTPRLGWKRKLRRWTIRLSIIYCVVVVGLVIAEPFLVYPALMFDNGQEAAMPDVTRGFVTWESITTDDNVELDTFHYCPRKSVTESRGVFLVCHGNGEWIGRMTGLLVQMGDHYDVSIFCYDYRGYGQSQGFPNEPGLLKDADAAYRRVIELGYAPNRIIVYGRSIGGGPSCYIASEHEIGGLILQNTFSSLVDVAANRFFWVPIRWIMRNRFDSVARLQQYNGPLLQTHGTADRVVPLHFGKRLFESAATSNDKKEFLTVQDGRHNGPISDGFRQKIKEFASQILD